MQQTQAQLRALELTVATDLTNAALQVQNYFQQVQAAAASRELAQKKLEAEQSKFDVGMSTNYNVVQYQRDFRDAQNSELRAILNYRRHLSTSSAFRSPQRRRAEIVADAGSTRALGKRKRVEKHA
jgi:outer membrane protein TolC